jgi:hypothetical protein
MLRHALAIVVLLAAVTTAACGGGPRTSNADLVSIRQPTPDPTLDAVVRDLPRMLAGVALPTSTPSPEAAVGRKPSALTPLVVTPRPTPRPPTATPTRTRR